MLLLTLSIQELIHLMLVVDASHSWAWLGYSLPRSSGQCMKLFSVPEQKEALVMEALVGA